LPNSINFCGLRQLENAFQIVTSEFISVKYFKPKTGSADGVVWRVIDRRLMLKSGHRQRTRVSKRAWQQQDVTQLATI
jgi:hypothetical protein